jgi:hypothetical protein
MISSIPSEVLHHFSSTPIRFRPAPFPAKLEILVKSQANLIPLLTGASVLIRLCHLEEKRTYSTAVLKYLILANGSGQWQLRELHLALRETEALLFSRVGTFTFLEWMIAATSWMYQLHRLQLLRSFLFPTTLDPTQMIRTALP